MNALPTRRTTFPSRPSVNPNRVAGAKPPCPGRATTNNGQRTTHNRGFTLVEMLVAIGILLILMVITIAAVNVTMDSDRITSGARSMQSFFAGARDRALFAGRPRGVRLIPDPNDPTLVTSILYIETPDPWPSRNLERTPGAAEGKVTIASTDFRTLAGAAPTSWLRFYQRGLLPTSRPARILIGTSPGPYQSPYTAVFSGGVWQLTKDHPGPYDTELDSVIFLEPAVLANQEPRTLPRGIAIDMDNTTADGDPIMSQLPASYVSGQPLDILFSPRGSVSGPLASAGTIHLRLVDTTDVSNNPADPSAGRDEFLVSIRTQTGRISTHPIYQAPAGQPADPFRYAELGEGSSP